jgi:hypothetical protein
VRDKQFSPSSGSMSSCTSLPEVLSPTNNKPQHSAPCLYTTAVMSPSLHTRYTHVTHEQWTCGVKTPWNMLPIYSCKLSTFSCISTELHSFAMYLEIRFSIHTVKILVSFSQKLLRLPERITEHVFQLSCNFS